MHGVFTRENIGEIRSDWVVTDNTTLTDAAITFAALEKGRVPELRQMYVNWLAFLEAVVLHGVTLADDRIFRDQPWIQTLKTAIGDCIAGVDLGDGTRREIKQDVHGFVAPLRDRLYEQLDNLRLDIEKTKGHSLDQVFNRANSDLHRSLFYISVASAVGLAYRPAVSRERVFASIIPSADSRTEQRRDYEAEISSGLLSRVLTSAQTYADHVQSLGGPTLITADLPPLASLVVAEAKRTGTWSEAIHNLRHSKAVGAFRGWLSDVVGCFETGDGKGVRLLKRANRFIDGWGSDPDEGLKYVTRTIGIGNFHSTMNFSLKYRFRDPVLMVPSHLVFLSKVFKSTVSLDGGIDPKGIPLK